MPQTRNGSSHVTTIDAPADADAGTAPDATAVTTVASTAPGSDDLAMQLGRLATLHDDGSLSDEEFGLAKRRVLHPPARTVTTRRISLHAPKTRIVPEIHPRETARSMSVAVLDRIARRLGASCSIEPATPSDSTPEPGPE